MDYIIGIDGGGTKTKGLLADASGNVIARAVAGPCNPNVVEAKELANVFRDLFFAMEQKGANLREKTVSVYAGISGAGNKQNGKKIRKILQAYVSRRAQVQVETDAVNALYAGTYGKPGIVQISGTGSITYGKNNQGREGRVGGWGYLFGDEGSGYDIGRQAVTAALKALDGRGPETTLLTMLYSHFQADHAQEIIREVYTSPSPKNKISPLAKLVFHAYKQNDHAAGQILSESAKNLALNILALFEKLFPADAEIPVVLSGGIFQDKDILPVLLQKELNRYTNLNFVLPEMSPAGGALIGASLMKKNEINEETITNIIHTEGKR